VYFGHRELRLAEPILDVETGKETGETIISQVPSEDESVDDLISRLEDENRAGTMTLLKVERPDNYAFLMQYITSQRQGVPATPKERHRVESIRKWLKRRLRK